MKKTILRNYAKLIAHSGAAIKKGDIVFIGGAELEQPEFVTMLVDECYKCGAERVIVDWFSPKISALHIKHMSKKTLSEVTPIDLARLEYRLEKNPAMIWISEGEPEGLTMRQQMKMVEAMQAKLKITKPYSKKMDNKYKWCIAEVPNAAWAKKVFPEEKRTSVALEKLWAAILLTARVIDKSGNLLDPIVEWEKHHDSFKRRCDILNSADLVSLKYKSSNGTDFRIGLIEQGNFLGGGERTLGGEFFFPNIPTEEIFTSPNKDTAEGTLVSSKPLFWNGELIENFSIRFEGGRAVEVHAEKNQYLLEKMIAMDEGASRLGECALVPFDSPINQSGLLFYSTLYDENAACHFALGEGFTNTITGFDKLQKEDFDAMGLNDSTIHVDFMIGSEDLSIVGVCRDGSELIVFEDGKWAF